MSQKPRKFVKPSLPYEMKIHRRGLLRALIVENLKKPSRFISGKIFPWIEGSFPLFLSEGPPPKSYGRESWGTPKTTSKMGSRICFLRGPTPLSKLFTENRCSKGVGGWQSEIGGKQARRRCWLKAKAVRDATRSGLLEQRQQNAQKTKQMSQHMLLQKKEREARACIITVCSMRLARRELEGVSWRLESTISNILVAVHKFFWDNAFWIAVTVVAAPSSLMYSHSTMWNSRELIHRDQLQLQLPILPELVNNDSTELGPFQGDRKST